MSGPVGEVLSCLKNVVCNGTGWTARCPGHDDKHNSLSIAAAEDGKVLLKCHAGCEVDHVVKTMGLEMKDLFPHADGGVSTPRDSRPPRHRRNKEQEKQQSSGGIVVVHPSATVPPGCTLEEYAEAKRLPVEFLESLGVVQISLHGRPAVKIPYFQDGGVERATRFRTGLAGGQRFRWRKGDKPRLYGQWRLEEARKAGYALLVEGESDCHTAWYRRLPCVGIPGAANWNEERDAELLDGIDVIYIVIENDMGGQTVQKWLRKSKIRERVRLIELDQYKDISGLHCDDPERFRDRINAGMEAAIPWPKLEQIGFERERREAWRKCQVIAEQCNILDLFARDYERSGVVEEVVNAKLLYLALTSRLFPKLVSIAVKGPSSGGKSYITGKAMAFFPRSAFLEVTSWSERALIYMGDDLQHRFIVMFEADTTESELSQMLMRTLLSEGKLIYHTVEKGHDGRMMPVCIEKEGPTGLLVTSTATNLHPENETRLLSLTVTDSQEQTRGVFRAIAIEGGDSVDLAPWVAFQQWLEGGECRVSIPFAPALANRTATIAVRLRRDFAAVLSLVRAHALLHQINREREAIGRIVATLADYRAVRELVASVIAEGVESTVPLSVRATVEAVKALADSDGATAATIGRHLNIDKSAARRRCRAAMDRGLLKNLETRKGRPGRYVIGDPMPEDEPVLPTADIIAAELATASDDDQERAALESEEVA